jgi:hypothetical protein
MKQALQTHRTAFSMLLLLALTLSFSGAHVVGDILAACAHDGLSRCGADPNDGSMSYAEDFPGEGVAGPKKGEVTRAATPLEARSDGMTLVSRLRVQDRNGGLQGRIADVAAHRNHAYLTAFRDPSCTRGGVHVVDISNPARPQELVGSFIPTSRGSYAGEGIKIRSISNASFTGDLLVFQNETCGTPKDKQSTGGISLWDVTRPNNPKLLSAHQGDFTLFDEQRRFPNQVHSFEVWTDHRTNKTYAALVDNEEFADVDIVDISNPRRPVMVNDTLDLFAATYQPSPAGLTSVFSHDMDVKRVGDRYVMTLNYWDGGYVLLDVTDPRVGEVTILAETDYAEVDEERAKRGESVPPEGNAHQSELSRDNDFLIGTDEDFDPYRTTATITSGPAAGTAFVTVNASGHPPVDPATGLTGQLTSVGEACGPLTAASTPIALIERGTCTFQEKYDAAMAAGYSAAIVFNNQREDCQSWVTMLSSGDRPFIFVNRTAGLQLLGVDTTTPCSTATPTGASAASIDISSVFDGWGYVRLFRADVGDGTAGSGRLDQIDTYAIPESQDAAFATGYGDLSVHEVAMDKRRNDIAYLSYYAGGIRAVRFGAGGIEEIGAFIDRGGSNFWGVEVHTIAGTDYLLASDRDYGLYIFRTLNP